MIHGPTKSEIFDGTCSLLLCSLRSLLWWTVTSCCGDTKVKGESWTSVWFNFRKSVYVKRKRGLAGVFVRPWGSVCVCVKGSIPLLAAPWETRLKQNLLFDCDVFSPSSVTSFICLWIRLHWARQTGPSNLGRLRIKAIIAVNLNVFYRTGAPCVITLNRVYN